MKAFDMLSPSFDQLMPQPPTSRPWLQHFSMFATASGESPHHCNRF